MLRRIILAGFILLLLELQAKAEEVSWQEIKGDHFIVCYTKNEAQAKDIENKAEGYYDKIASDLGYPRYSNFWQWENRVKIFIYPDRESFQAATGQMAWSEGAANFNRKEIATFERSGDFSQTILPHEMTHLIFRDFVGFKGEVPLWIDEGVAQWEEPFKRAIAKKVAAFLLKNNKAMPIEELTRMDIRHSSDSEEVRYFYMQAVTVIDFLVRRYGPGNFTEFCRQLRDGKDLNEAISFAYSGSLSGLQSLEQEWKKDVLN